MPIARTPTAVHLRARFVIAVWTALGILNCIEMRVSFVIDGRPITWLQLLSACMPRAYVWAIMTPVIFAMSARFPVRHRITSATLFAHIATWAACLTLQALVNTVTRVGDIARALSFTAFITRGVFLWIPSTLVLYCATAGVAQLLLSTERERQRESEQALMSGQLAKAELAALRIQLHPHFLFNTLNTIAILIREHDTGVAERLVTQLGDVLRQVLRSAQANETKLAEELEFVRTYLAIEQVRFGDRLVVRWCVDQSLVQATIPVLLLQPLVENALRHGIAHLEDGGVVEIGARRDGEELKLWVTDNGRGLDDRAADAASRHEGGAGVGILNTRQRLEQLYPGRAQLTVRRTDGGDTRADVTLPYRIWSGARVADGTP
ncbi:MAG: histidine kinase [bacterium]